MHTLQKAFERGFKKRANELLLGGKADGMPDSAFKADQIRQGIKEEKEHTNNVKARKEIAKDHLMEDSNYYTKLKSIEKKM